MPRNVSLAPGTFAMRPPISPPVTDSATPSVQPAVAQPAEHRVLHRLVVDAEHEVAEDRAQLALLGLDERARRVVGLAPSR